VPAVLCLLSALKDVLDTVSTHKTAIAAAEGAAVPPVLRQMVDTVHEGLVGVPSLLSRLDRTAAEQNNKVMAVAVLCFVNSVQTACGCELRACTSLRARTLRPCVFCESDKCKQRFLIAWSTEHFCCCCQHWLLLL
jgi:hypothetical protein